MYTLDSDILAILLAIISFTIPAINAVREKKKKQRAQEQAQNSPYHFHEQEQQEHIHTIGDESPDELRRKEMEELFSELLGLEHKVEELQEESAEEIQNPVMQQEQPYEDVDAVEETVLDVVPQMQETVVEHPQQEGIQATVCSVQEESAPAQEENAKSLKERIRNNPKDMVLFAEILKPKFKEFEN